MGWFEVDEEKEEKVDKIIKSLLIELDKVDRWDGTSGRVYHKEYDFNVDKDDINKPHPVSIPSRWKKEIARKLEAIGRYNQLDKLDFVYDVLNHKYPIHIKNLSDEQLAWCKENKVLYRTRRDYHLWFYIEEGAGALAFKLRWL